MRIALLGNPNVGKSSLFHRLTGVGVVCSNYPGTTVSLCTGTMRYGDIVAEVVDTPGIYSFSAETPAECAAADMLASADVVVDVVDATNLERSLYLALQVIESGKAAVVALNMADDAKHLGVEIDRKLLEELLGVPVVGTVAVTGEGVKDLVERLREARPQAAKRTDDERWKHVGHIVGSVQALHDKGHTLIELLEDSTIKPLTGLPIALFVLLLTFFAIVGAGNAIVAALDPFFRGVWTPAMTYVVGTAVPSGPLHDILIDSSPDIVDGLGLLTTGFYVPFAMILPFVALFYFALSMLEDTGYLPRLATLLDNVMHRVGLHGSAIIPAALGMGCRVPGILATRILETRKQRFISATLLSICIPCLAQNAVIFGLLAPRGLQYVLIVYGTVTLLFVLIGTALNRLIPGDSPEMLLEIPPYRLPRLGTALKKTWLRVRHFLTEAAPQIMVGVFAVNLLKTTGAVDAFARTFGPPMSALFGLPKEAVIAVIVGFLRKDFAVGMLSPIPMSSMELTVASTLVVISFPCLATLTVLYTEFGPWDFLKAMALMLAVTAITGVTMRLVLL
ncbi:MAG: ferrous iron transporter B [Candidatus Altiarchaeota archaeon]